MRLPLTYFFEKTHTCTALLAACSLWLLGCHKPAVPAPAPPPPPIVADDPASWPHTVDEAATRILAHMTEENKALVKNTPRAQLIRFHLGWGMGIRNSTGLWRGNNALIESTGQSHPDDASQVIIEAIWLRLQTPQTGANTQP